MFRPVRLARPEDPEALHQHALNQRSPAEGKREKVKSRSSPTARPEPTVTGRREKVKGRNSPTARPERAEALSPGQRPGLLWMQGCRPVRAKALCIAWAF